MMKARNHAMTSKFVLGTLTILAALVTLQNFNFLTLDGRRGIPEMVSASGQRSGGKGTQSMLVGQRESAMAASGNPYAVAGYRIKTVVLDAGHGGKDPGCSGATAHEKDNALAIVLQLGAYIQANCPSVKVIYTREKDVFVELNERAAIANRNKADLFISVHCNSMPVARVSGTETYVLGVNRAGHNLEVAKRENSVISLEDNYRQKYDGYDPNSPEAHILNSVWQSAYLEQSILFASLVQQQAHLQADREDKGVKQAGFLVIRETAMPAVLIESGYLTNAVEEAFMASEDGRNKMAYAIFRAFMSYRAQLEGHAIEPMQQPAPTPPKTIKTGAPKPVPVQTAHSQKSNITVISPLKTSKGAAPPTAAVAKTIYRIQLLSWKTRMDRQTGRLSLLSDIKEEVANNQYYYFTGTFATRDEAMRVLPEIKNLGFKTAVVVPVGGRE